MSTLLTWTAANTAMACALALVAWLSRRWLCRPALTHALWVLVLLKFVTPPLGTFALPLPMPVPPATPAVVEPEIAAPSHLVGRVSRPVRDDRAVNTDGPGDPSYEVGRQFEDECPFVLLDDGPEPSSIAPAVPAVEAAPTPWSFEWVVPTLGWLWFGGTGLWFLVVTVRLIRFQRVLRLARPAPEDVRTRAQDLAGQLGVACPEVLVIPGSVSPLLWVWRQRACLVLPAALMERLSPEQWATVLTHELAHWRRGDHWVRRLEMLVLGLYWWNPIVWLARRMLHEAEEECCDAWVVTTLPEAAKAYALALVETLDFLAGVPAVLPMGASGVGQLPSLQRRLTMILSTRPQRSLTVLGGMVLAATALALLPWIPSWAQEGDRPAKKDKGRPPEENKEGFEPRRDKPNPPEGGKPFPPDAGRFEAELRKAQEELERAKQQFQDRMRELNGRQGGPKEGGERPFGPGPGGPGGFGGPPRDFEKRLTDVERKLDTLLWELSNLRKEMAPRPFRPEGNPPPPPGDGPRRKPGEGPPPERKGEGDGVRRRIERPEGGNPPQPPVQRRNNENE